MTTVNVHTAKTNLSALLHSVEERHERIVISRYGKAVAELVLVSAISAWEIGLKQAKGKLSLPLPPDAWFRRALEGLTIMGMTIGRAKTTPVCLSGG